MQTKYRQKSGLFLVQRFYRYLSVFCLYGFWKDFFDPYRFRTDFDLDQTNICTVSHIKSGPDFFPYAICPPLLSTNVLWELQSEFRAYVENPECKIFLVSMWTHDADFEKCCAWAGNAAKFTLREYPIGGPVNTILRVKRSSGVILVIFVKSKNHASYSILTMNSFKTVTDSIFNFSCSKSACLCIQSLGFLFKQLLKWK